MMTPLIINTLAPHNLEMAYANILILSNRYRALLHVSDYCGDHGQMRTHNNIIDFISVEKGPIIQKCYFLKSNMKVAFDQQIANMQSNPDTLSDAIGDQMLQHQHVFDAVNYVIQTLN
jgi:hypothetical protein